MKVHDFVKDALGLIGVVDARQAVSAVDMQTGIRVLNQLCARLEANTLSLGWSAVDNPDGTLPLPDEAQLPIQYQLAILLAPHFSVPVTPDIRATAADLMNDLRRDQAVATPIQPLLDVPTPSAGAPRDNLWVG